ncbi:hypothetical protein DFQ30_003287 [Apophysomyces sp. BC1015]|nr:hypothetical protein DFQ30_003287 [Apophysomyces sp. BC1015]KAG0179245.1 hypothetical protein DFQ29_002336 [Apophysomyces sp. BC1021]
MKISLLASLLVSTVVSAAVFPRQEYTAQKDHGDGTLEGNWYPTALTENIRKEAFGDLAKVNLTIICEQLHITNPTKTSVSLDEKVTLQRTDTKAVAAVTATGKFDLTEKPDRRGVFGIKYSVSEFTVKKADWDRLYPGYNNGDNSGTMTVPGTVPASTSGKAIFVSSENNHKFDAVYLWFAEKDIAHSEGGKSNEDWATNQIYGAVYTRTQSIDEQALENIKKQIPAEGSSSPLVKCDNQCGQH